VELTSDATPPTAVATRWSPRSNIGLVDAARRTPDMPLRFAIGFTKYEKADLIAFVRSP
jgi:hypothetical protein